MFKSHCLVLIVIYVIYLEYLYSMHLLHNFLYKTFEFCIGADLKQPN